MIQPELPEYDFSLVIRTDYSDDTVWEQICKLLGEPQTPYRFQASVECISDRACAGLQPDDVRSVLPHDSHRPFVFLVDSEAVLRPDHAVLVVDLYDRPGRCFRVIPSEAWSVENNLRLANMDFDEFAGVVDDTGVFRGFPGGPE